MKGVSTAFAARLRDEIHAEWFSPSDDGGRPRIGAEVEFLVLDVGTRRPLPLEGRERALLHLLRAYAQAFGWREGLTASGTPRFDVPRRATVTFEPGGQIEISTLACATPNDLLENLEAVVSPLRAWLTDRGVELLAVGIDPLTPIECVPLQLHVDRYERMTRYFDRIGPYGVRMMRQTAAVQISVDRGRTPVARWRLLNNLSPFIIAIFANSAYYAGRDSRHKSFRARCWRMLDETRTGTVAAGGDSAAEYMEFGFAARDMMREDARGEYRPFGDWLAAGEWDRARWMRHLTTLFPEVRPRGHFEIRSSDAIDPSWYPALIVFVAGAVYDATSAAEVERLITPGSALLERAGHCGLADPAIARIAGDLVQLALEGAARLPANYLAPVYIDRAREIFDSHTARGISPADLSLRGHADRGEGAASRADGPAFAE